MGARARVRFGKLIGRSQRVARMKRRRNPGDPGIRFAPSELRGPAVQRSSHAAWITKRQRTALCCSASVLAQTLGATFCECAHHDADDGCIEREQHASVPGGHSQEPEDLERIAPLAAASTSAQALSRKRPYASTSRIAEYIAAPAASSSRLESFSFAAASRKICGYLDAGFRCACLTRMAAAAWRS